MVRSICCAMVLLTGGVAPSAPPEVIFPTSPPAQIRFLSLAEARALALEHGDINKCTFEFPGGGLDNATYQPQAPGSHRVLADLTHGTDGVLVTGIPRQVPQAKLERPINQRLLNAETAYWNLYGSYGQLHSREQGLRFAYESWKLTKAKYAAGTAHRDSLAQAEGRYNLFRRQRLQAFDTVLDNECQLRAMLLMPINDGTRLVPSDAPTLIEKKPDWEKELAEALKNRPEVRIARVEESNAADDLTYAKSRFWPELGFYGVKETDFDPRDDSYGKPGWSDPSGGFYPPLVGFQRMQFRMNQTRLHLQDQELKAERFLGLYYRRMSSAYFQIKAARAQRKAFATQVREQSASYRTDGKVATLNLLLEAQRFWADAFATECQAAVTYNNALAGWEYAKGASMDYAHVTLAEKPPCGCGNVSAVVYQGERTRMRVRHMQPVQANNALTVPVVCSPAALWKRFPPLLDAEELPTVEKVSFPKDVGADKLLTEWKVSDIFPPRPKHVKRVPF